MAESHGTAHSATAHTAAEGAHGGFPPFNPSTFASQLVWFAITFVALYIIVSRIALPRVGSIIEARRNSIEGDLAEAQRHKDESDRAIAEYEAELAAARSRAQGIASDTRDRLNAESESARKTLDDALTVKLVAAEKTVAATRQAAMANVRGIAVDTASAIVQRLTGATPDTKAVETAVDTSLKG